ncbi:MAG: hypothetical protein K8S00_10230 [Bacteroidales bacterium]|nr:hypothetical protein [Bacteroidales bacterium]
MDTIDIVICLVAFITILAQSFISQLRHFIMAAGASLGLFLVWLKTDSIIEPLQSIPLDVMLILVGLTLFGDFILKSNLFGIMIRKIANICQGKQWLIYLLFSILIFFLSAVLNNYQAVLLLTPALIGILSQLRNVSKLYVSVLFGTLIVLSNLGGASLPISDFPALVMFTKGIISFQSYVPNVTPMVALATLIVIGFGLLFIHIKTKASSAEESKLSAAFTTALYRSVKLNKTKLFWSSVVFAGMMVFWVKGVNPAVVTVVGLIVLAIIIEKGRFLENRIKNLNTSIFIFYLCLFAVIASIQSTPLLSIVAKWLSFQTGDPLTLIVLFSVTITMVTAIVSAGPATIALLPVATGISSLYPDNMVITCFALSICAGSSIFTFSATAGPLVQSLSEKYELKVEGRSLSFGLKEYLVPGIVGGAIILSVNVLYILLTL